MIFVKGSLKFTVTRETATHYEGFVFNSKSPTHAPITLSMRKGQNMVSKGWHEQAESVEKVIAKMEDVDSLPAYVLDDRAKTWIKGYAKQLREALGDPV